MEYLLQQATQFADIQAGIRWTSAFYLSCKIIAILQAHTINAYSPMEASWSHREMGSWKCAGMDCNDWRKTRHHIEGLGFVFFFFFFFLECDCYKPAGLKIFPEKEVILQPLQNYWQGEGDVPIYFHTSPCRRGVASSSVTLKFHLFVFFVLQISFALAIFLQPKLALKIKAILVQEPSWEWHDSSAATSALLQDQRRSICRSRPCIANNLKGDP